MESQSRAVEVVEFGPLHGVGVSVLAKGGKTDFAAVWQQQLMPRHGEIAVSGGPFAVCRCVPGATDGSFDYLAMFQARADAPVPAGMVSIDVPRGLYLAIPVASYDQLAAGWQSIPQRLAERPDLKPYCGPEGCACAEHPAFELYATEPDRMGQATIYVPVKRV